MTKFCKKCIWSNPEVGSEWTLRCSNPKVNAKDEWALASASINGTSCTRERALTWPFGACGKRGAQYEPVVS